MWSMWRCVSSTSTRTTSGSSARPRRRMPVPASSTTGGVGGRPHLDARRVAAVAHGLVPGRRLRPARAPHRDLHCCSQKIATAPSSSPHCPFSGIAAISRRRRTPSSPRIQIRPCAGRCSASAIASGSFSVGIGAPRAVRRLEHRRPLLERHRAGLVEATAEQLFGRLVVVDEVAVGVDDEDRGRQMVGELAQQDDLDRLTRHGHLSVDAAARYRQVARRGRMRRVIDVGRAAQSGAAPPHRRHARA